MAPPLSSARPCGPECGVFSANSFIAPVFGSRRPSPFAVWPVYQIEPSEAAIGSCGREAGVVAAPSAAAMRDNAVFIAMSSPKMGPGWSGEAPAYRSNSRSQAATAPLARERQAVVGPDDHTTDLQGKGKGDDRHHRLPVA